MFIGSVIRFGEEELWELVKSPIVFEKPEPVPDVKMGDRRKWIKLPPQIYMAITRLKTWGELALVLLEAFREIEVVSTYVCSNSKLERMFSNFSIFSNSVLIFRKKYFLKILQFSLRNLRKFNILGDFDLFRETC